MKVPPGLGTGPGNRGNDSLAPAGLVPRAEQLHRFVENTSAVWRLETIVP